MDTSSMPSVEQRLKRKLGKLKGPCLDIISSHVNVADIHDQLKTNYDLDRKTNVPVLPKNFLRSNGLSSC